MYAHTPKPSNFSFWNTVSRYRLILPITCLMKQGESDSSRQSGTAAPALRVPTKLFTFVLFLHLLQL